MRPALPTHLTDHQLLSEAKRYAQCERDATAQLVAHLAEIDARHLYLGAGFSSLFAYCCEVLHLSESESYNRIEAARAARRFPAVLAALEGASVNLTTVRLLAPHLTESNHQELLAAAGGRRKREVEELVARRFPRADVTASIRKLPAAQQAVAGVIGANARTIEDAAQAPGARAGVAPPDALAPALDAGPQVEPSSVAAAPARRHPLAVPLAPDRYQIKFTASAATWEKLRLARDLLRHAVPSGDPAEILDRALSVLIQDLTKKKCAAVASPRSDGRTSAPGSRRVPARVRRVVWIRDQGRCAFVAPSGRRCGERAFLEFHHVQPYGAGGEATVENIQLRCRAHNAYEAMLFYGTDAFGRAKAASESVQRPRLGAGAGKAARSGTS